MIYKWGWFSYSGPETDTQELFSKKTFIPLKTPLSLQAARLVCRRCRRKETGGIGM
jgi:hypothetical protein